jgi:hypothetical protein
VRQLALDFEFNKTDTSNESLLVDRAYKLDAILVRIMKGRGSMQLMDLISECYSVVSKIFMPDSK